jgi:hypothetical protein
MFDDIGELIVGVRILLDKGPSRHHISEDQQFQENTHKFIFHRKMEVARRRVSWHFENSSHGDGLTEGLDSVQRRFWLEIG